MKPYFSHDEGARNDPKLVKVLMRLGQAGKGVYWDLVEMLYEQGGFLSLTECESYAFALRTDCDLILKLVHDFDLFESDTTHFWSETCLERMKMRDAKKEARALAGAKGGKIKAEKEAAAKALLQQIPSIAIAKASNAIAIKRNEMKGNTSNDVAPLPAEDLKAKLSNDLTARLAALTDTSGEILWSESILSKQNYFAKTARKLITAPDVDLEHYRRAMLIAAEAGNLSRDLKGWESWVSIFLTNQLQRGPLLTMVAATVDLTRATPRHELPPAGTDCTGRHIVLTNTGDANMNRMFAANYQRDYPNATIHHIR